MFFSVIIPLYNKAPYVAKAIQSVLSQTYEDYELIVMDDGSKDDSFSIALKTIEGCGHCHLYRQKNSGVSEARNNGVALSQGDYLCFLDADDWWEPTFLEEMSKLIEEFPDAGIYGTNYTIVNETKHKTRVAPIGVEAGFEKGYINYCQVYAKTLAMPLTSISVSVPRSVFKELGGFSTNLDLGEDFDLWIRIALKNRVVLLNKPLSNYNQDVDPTYRGTHRGKHHPRNPDKHYLWNIDYLEVEEKRNPDLKFLIDKLRAYTLMHYYLDPKFRSRAKTELAKINWDSLPSAVKRRYAIPIPLLKINQLIMKILMAVHNKIKNGKSV